MVYESDFYTVRRPRPTITSYSVTRRQVPWEKVPTVPRPSQIPQPYTVYGSSGNYYSGSHSPRLGVSNWNVKPSIRTSVLLGELDRIYHRPRPQLGHIHLEDYLNSKPLVDFDDETKQIRAETDRLRRRIHLSVPHPRHSAPLQTLPYYGSCYDRVPSPDKHYHNMVDDILCMSYYSEPTARTIGRGHLACVTFAGGRGYPRRRNHYSDENRDIKEEIKTRSYYHNNFNKNYVDAMSLPTGYASYLLRLKPPESNETLTNLDKMHIIALAEERKKNLRKNKTDGDLTDSEPKSKWLNGFSTPAEQNSSKVLKKQLSKTKDESITKNIEEPKHEAPAEDINIYERKLSKQASVTKQETEKEVEPPKEVSIDKELDKEVPEVTKLEKKSKPKKSSLSRNSSIQESPKPVVEELLSKPEEKKEELPKEEEIQYPVDNKSIEEPLVIEETQPEPESQQEVTEAVDNVTEDVVTPEIPPPSTEIPLNDILDDTLPTTEPAAAESSTHESAPEPVERKEETEPVESSTVSDEAAVDAAEVTNTQSEPSQESEKVIEKEEDITSDQKEAVETKENILASEPQVDVTTEVPSEESIITEENTSQEVAVTESTEVVPPESVPEALEADSSQKETEVTEFLTNETTFTTSTVVTTTTEISIENVIEEVSHSSEDTAQKGNESEPLIEEPQSPCDYTNIITDQINSNEICEVLSDVPE